MSQQELASDNVKVVVSQEPGCHITFHLTVPPQVAQAGYNKAIRAVNKEVSLPGFRKGKAPEKLVIQHYSKYVDREWRTLVMDTAFREAVELTQIRPLHQQAVEAPEVNRMSIDEGVELTIKFESMPTIPKIELDQLKLEPVEQQAVSQQDIDQAIEDLRLFHANWQEITDRPIQIGDYIDVDIDALESPAYTICTNERFQVTNDRMPAWMSQLVIGLSLGQSAEGVSERDDKFAPKPDSPDFKPTQVRVTIKAIKQAELPPLDDALALKAGVETAEELKKRVIITLERKHADEADMAMRDQLQSQLLQKFDFDLPSSVVEAERQTRIRNRIRGLKSRRASDEDIQRQSGELEQMAHEEAEAFVRLYYLLRPIVQEKTAGITQSDLFQELTRQMHQLSPEEQVIEPQMEPQTLRGKLIAVLGIRKAEDWLMSQLRPM